MDGPVDLDLPDIKVKLEPACFNGLDAPSSNTDESGTALPQEVDVMAEQNTPTFLTSTSAVIGIGRNAEVNGRKSKNVWLDLFHPGSLGIPLQKQQQQQQPKQQQLQKEAPLDDAEGFSERLRVPSEFKSAFDNSDNNKSNINPPKDAGDKAAAGPVPVAMFLNTANSAVLPINCAVTPSVNNTSNTNTNFQSLLVDNLQSTNVCLGQLSSPSPTQDNVPWYMVPTIPHKVSKPPVKILPQLKPSVKILPQLKPSVKIPPLVTPCVEIIQAAEPTPTVVSDNHKVYTKPILSNSHLLALAIANRPDQVGRFPDIYNFICYHFPFFKDAGQSVRSSFRHAISSHNLFVKIAEENGGETKVLKRGNIWTLNSSRIGGLASGFAEWREHEINSNRSSMAFPDEMDSLLKACDPSPLLVSLLSAPSRLSSTPSSSSSHRKVIGTKTSKKKIHKNLVSVLDPHSSTLDNR